MLIGFEFLPAVLCGLRIGIATSAIYVVSILYTGSKPHGISLTASSYFVSFYIANV